MERRDRAQVNRFVVESALGAGGTVDLPDAAAHHARVKRLTAGDAVTLTDGRGGVATGAGGFFIRQNQGGSTIGHHGAIGTTQRASNQRILFRNLIAELQAQVTTYMGVRVSQGIHVVLGGNLRQGMAVIAITIKVGLGDLTKNSRKTQRIVLFLSITTGAENFRNAGRWHTRHFFCTNSNPDAGRSRACSPR